MPGVSISLAGRVAVITGSGSGIGAAMARLFARAGATVVVADRNGAAAEGVARQCGDEGGKAWAVETDVCSTADVNSLFDSIQRREGRLDILVNNAARTDSRIDKTFAGHTAEDWQGCMEVIFHGTAACCAAALPMLKTARGTILNVSSVHAASPRNGAAYGAAKAAVENLTRKLAAELAADGIRVNALAPGWIDTAGIAWAMTDPVATANAVEQLVPLKRVGRPEEMANVALFLVSDLASYMTGSIVLADGGWLLR
jgi:NAD(P)-dependent dehydrogenase (short-subunit alcohol dehydrogenase family)